MKISIYGSLLTYKGHQRSNQMSPRLNMTIMVLMNNVQSSTLLSQNETLSAVLLVVFTATQRWTPSLGSSQ